jgi:uncharacterized repeat protein (TIGR01451 family)
MAQPWTPVNAASGPRVLAQAVTLGDGRVLMSGGYDGQKDALADAQVFSPSTGRWRATGAMSKPRMHHSLTRLPDGRVLAAGGYGCFCSGGSGLSTEDSAEIFDPAGSWTPVASMHVARAGHAATLLNDGTVLVAGGAQASAVVASAEIFDPAHGTWTPVEDMTSARSGHTATLLPDGRVLVAGGRNGGVLDSAEIYDPATRAWKATGTMKAPRVGQTATLLAGGRVLVAGDPAAAEIYDVAAGTWSTTGAMSTVRQGHIAALLPGNRVLVAGGWTPAADQATSSAEVYSLDTGKWARITPMNSSRQSHVAATIGTGKILVATGRDSGGQALASAEVFTNPEFADLSVRKSADHDAVRAGEPVTYTVEVANSGPQGATDVVVIDDLPATVRYVSSSSTAGTCSFGGRTVTCEVGTVDAGTGVTVTIVVEPTESGDLSNTAIASANEFDPDPSNDSATARTYVGPARGSIDTDGDGTGDDFDNCPFYASPDQSDRDGDGVGDACDNCGALPNPYQENSDGDRYGDRCDDCKCMPNDDQADGDHDRAGDACDTLPDQANGVCVEPGDPSDGTEDEHLVPQSQVTCVDVPTGRPRQICY